MAHHLGEAAIGRTWVGFGARFCYALEVDEACGALPVREVEAGLVNAPGHLPPAKEWTNGAPKRGYCIKIESL